MTNADSTVTPGLVIRAATRKDAAAIESLAKEVRAYVVQERKPYFGPLVDFASSEPAYERAIADPDQAIFVAELEGQVVGYVYCMHETTPDDLIAIPYIYVFELTVKSDMRKGGIGHGLMAEVEIWGKKRGLRVVHLAVWEFNADALKFYESLGYATLMRKMEKVL